MRRTSTTQKKKPNLTVIKRLRELRAEGYAIVFHTARRMRTFKGDEAKVIEDVGLTTLEWLKRHDVPCDGLRFGKPFCENGFIVDDMAVRPLELLSTPTAELKKRLQSERERLEVGDNL
jgi:capsule biosynthesis phosphatase